VRVGRAALDEDAIRLIEEHNPDVTFDWTRILKGEPATPEPRPRQDLPERRARPRPRQTPTVARTPEAEPSTVARTPEMPLQQAEEMSLAGDQAQLAPVPAFDEDGTPTDAMAEERAAEAAEPVAPSAALARLGAEDLLRLRARHSEVLARISEKVSDPARRDELKARADRLNPDTWVTDADVAAGLEQYETVFESLRSVVGRRRKRRRRRTSGAQGGPSTEAGAAAPEPADEDEGDEL
jgi:ribonuclease E